MVADARTLPELPLLAPWYRVVADGERLVLEHGGRVVALEGAAVRRLVPHLLPLLDGSRTVAEVVDLVGRAAEPAVRRALALLADHGLLVEGPASGFGADVGETVAYLASGGGLAPATVAGRLADATVGVVGAGAAAVEAARVLRRSGVGTIERLGWDDDTPGDLVVVGPAADELGQLLPWNEACLRTARPWLPVLPWDGRFAAVGPLVVPGETACHACYRLRRAASLGVGELSDLLDAAPLRAGGGPALAVAAGAIAGAHALRWLGVGDPTLPGALHALEGAGGLRLTVHPVLRVPRCPACSERRRTAAPLPWFQPSSRRDAA